MAAGARRISMNTLFTYRKLPYAQFIPNQYQEIRQKPANTATPKRERGKKKKEKKKVLSGSVTFPLSY